MPARPSRLRLSQIPSGISDQAHEKRPRQHQKRQNADVGVLGFAAQRGGQQEEPEDGGGGDDHHARQADPVVGQVDDRGQPAPVPAIRIDWASCI